MGRKLLFTCLLVPLLLAANPQDSTLQSIVELEVERETEAAAWQPFLSSSNPMAVRLYAMRAIGHVGVASLAPLVMQGLVDQDEAIRLAAAEAAVFIDALSSQRLRDFYQSEESLQVKERLSFAIGKRAAAEDGGFLYDAMTSLTTPLAIEAFGHWLAASTTETAIESAWLEHLLQLAGTGDARALAASYAIARFRSQPDKLPATLLTLLPRVRDDQSKAYLLRGLARFVGRSEEEAARRLAEATLFSEAGLSSRVEAARVLAAFAPSPELLHGIATLSRNTPRPILLQVLATLRSFGEGAAGLAPLLEESVATIDRRREPYLAAELLMTLAAVAPARASSYADTFLAETDETLVVAAVQVLGGTDTTETIDRLIAWSTDARSRVRVAALDLLAGRTPADEDTAAVTDAISAALATGDLATVASAAVLAERYELRSLLPQLLATYDYFARVDDLEAKITLLDAIGSLGNERHLDFLRTALADGQRPVAQAAAAAIGKISGEDVTAQVPVVSARSMTVPSLRLMNEAIRSRVILHTAKGPIVLVMLPSAPLAATNFVELARQGFYDGLTFHRVIPNFVAQGGDPRGDGYGGPGYLIRDEFSLQRHLPGTVGMASAGKDTAGSQFFINTGTNLHLDGNYTLFARVIAGLKIAQQLAPGDVIISAEVRLGKF